MYRRALQMGKFAPMGLQTRTFFSRRPTYFLSPVFENMDKTFREMEKEMDKVFRRFGASDFLPSPFGRQKYLSGSDPSIWEIVRPTPGEKNGHYQLNIQLGEGFKPEDIKVTLKDRVLQVEAKFEEKSEDGSSRRYIEMSQQFSLPQGVKPEDVKTLISDDGLLTIEAPLPEAQKPKEIPITRK